MPARRSPTAAEAEIATSLPAARPSCPGIGFWGDLAGMTSRRWIKVAHGCARRTRPGQGQSHARRARPARRRLSPARQPGGVRRRRRSSDFGAWRGAGAGRARRKRRRRGRSTTISCSRPRVRSPPKCRGSSPRPHSRWKNFAGGGGTRRRVVRTPPRRCGFWRARTASADDPRLSLRWRAGSAPTCRSASIRARGGCAASAKSCRRRCRSRSFAAVLVNPGVAVPTRDVFAMLGLKPGGRTTPGAAPALPRDRDGFIAYPRRAGQRS